MAVGHLFLIIVLFTTAVCLIGAIPEHVKGRLTLDANSQNCSCENGNCVTDKLGRSKCVCKPRFSLQDEFTCKPCDCGSLETCIFTLKLIDDDEYQYQKKCLCSVGRAEKDGVCVDCFCGENSACDFDHDERRCYCVDGFSEKDGVCTKCDCGFMGECEYENGTKKCKCDEGYLELNGTCEECDCGSNSEKCMFDGGVKRCKCKDRYADRYGTCAECYCGDHTKSCIFNENQKRCSCLEGYVQKGEMCELGCSANHPCQNGGYCKEGFCSCLNGTSGEFCEVIDGCSTLCPDQGDIKCSYDVASQRTYCTCLDSDLSYDPKMKLCRRTCQNDRSCKNQGKCAGTPNQMFCYCLEGTTGDFCEEIPVCSGVNCGPDAYCVFNPSTKKADCACKNAKYKYDSSIGSCRRMCTTDIDCFNGGSCGPDKHCYCPPGTQGDRCQIVDDCHFDRLKCVGENAYCTFDLNTRNATCKCKNWNEVYDFRLEKCKGFCNKHKDCFNGGNCGYEGFCYCLPGTQGPRCEIVDDCYLGRIQCYGGSDCCIFDLGTLSAKCEC